MNFGNPNNLAVGTLQEPYYSGRILILRVEGTKTHSLMDIRPALTESATGAGLGPHTAEGNPER